MVESKILAQEYFLNRHNLPINVISNILDKLNYILITQINELYTKRVNIDYWQNPMEALCFKLSLHVASLQKLLQKSSVPFNEGILEIFDISSINIISRAITENYLTLYHFHFELITNEHKEFRFLIYALSALKNRQLFSVPTSEKKNQYERDKIEIANFENALVNNSYFKSLPTKNQKHYLSTKDAKQLPWTTLLDESDLKPEFFKDTWRLQSNYAHSEFLSVLQIKDFPQNPEQLKSSSYVMAELATIILSVTINHVNELFSESKRVFVSLDEDTKQMVNYFCKVGTKSV